MAKNLQKYSNNNCKKLSQMSRANGKISQIAMQKFDPKVSMPVFRMKVRSSHLFLDADAAFHRLLFASLDQTPAAGVCVAIGRVRPPYRSASFLRRSVCECPLRSGSEARPRFLNKNNFFHAKLLK